MTVKELIEKLQEYDEDVVVMFDKDAYEAHIGKIIKYANGRVVLYPKNTKEFV